MARNDPGGKPHDPALGTTRYTDRRPGVQILNDTVIYTGWTSLRRLTVRMPDGAEVERHVEHHGSAAAVLPYDAERRCALLVSMPRAVVTLSAHDDLLEVIAGALDGEDPEPCARREAMEEAGVRLSVLEPVGCTWSMPTLSTERITGFLAPYRSDDRIAPGGGAPGEHENIRVHEIGLDDLADRARDGRLCDMKTLLLVQALQLRHPRLFAGTIV